MAMLQLPDDLYTRLQAAAAAQNITVEAWLQQQLPPHETTQTASKAFNLPNRELVEQLELAIKTANLGIWRLDIASGQLVWNEQMHRIYGITPEEFAEDMNGWRQQVHPDDRDYANQQFAEIFSHGEVYDVQFRIFRPDGELRYLDASGVAIYDAAGEVETVIGINVDVTDYERSKQALKESEYRYRSLFNNSLTPILICDDDATIIMLNDMAAVQLNTTPEDAVGAPLRTFSPDYHATMVDRIQQVLATGNPQFVEDYLEINDKGTWWWSVIQPTGTTSNHIQIISYDITERKQAEQREADHTRLKRRLEQERALATQRSQMLTRLSHEFRTPLAILLTSSDLLRRYYEKLPADKRTQKLNNITDQVHRLNRLLNEIGMLARQTDDIMNFHPSDTQVHKLCETINNDIEPTLLPAHTLICEFDVDDTPILLDKQLIHHALTHLLSNAITYSPDGGNIYFRAWQDNDTLYFQVKDEGIGIPSGEQQVIRGAFRRASNSNNTRGVGLGLYLVDEITKRHNGTLEIDSQPGSGSTVTVQLPVIPAD